MIGVSGSVIEDQIIVEIQPTKFFTILADEVTDSSNLEQVSIVIRFVDGDQHIKVDFLNFITVERITGEFLANVLLSWLESHNTNVSFYRGQGYDRASKMSSSTAGVQAWIRSVSPMAFYIHCQSHQLNLSVVKAYSIAQIRYANDVISKIAFFFSIIPQSPSTSFSTSLMRIAQQDKKEIKDLCKTCWVQRIDPYTVFHDPHASIIKMMEASCTKWIHPW